MPAQARHSAPVTPRAPCHPVCIPSPRTVCVTPYGAFTRFKLICRRIEIAHKIQNHPKTSSPRTRCHPIQFSSPRTTFVTPFLSLHFNFVTPDVHRHPVPVTPFVFRHSTHTSPPVFCLPVWFLAPRTLRVTPFHVTPINLRHPAVSTSPRSTLHVTPVYVTPIDLRHPAVSTSLRTSFVSLLGS